jgi:hypothetical protein
VIVDPSVPANVKMFEIVAVLPFAIVSVPVELVIVRPLIDVAEAAPSVGVTRVGEVASTSTPDPVSFVMTPENCADVVGANCESGFDVSASPEPEPAMSVHVFVAEQKYTPALDPVFWKISPVRQSVGSVPELAIRVRVCAEAGQAVPVRTARTIRSDVSVRRIVKAPQ